MFSRAGIKNRASKKPTERQRRLITRSIITLRTKEGNFSAVRIMEQAGNDNSEVSLRTVTRFLKWKRLLLFTSTQERAFKKRWSLLLNGARNIYLRIFGLSIYHSFWTELDLPTNQISVSKLVQQRGGHGERYQRVLPWVVHQKGRKEGTAGKVLKLMVAIS